MKLGIIAVGRLRKGPEKVLIDDYAARASAGGRPLALGPLTITEIDERKAVDRKAQGVRLLEAVPSGARIIALDERGKPLSSPAVSDLLCEWRDSGVGETVGVIGGADGLDDAVRQRADRVLSFGAMVWPHMLARVMLTEQIYRAIAIAAGTPYHRA